MMEFVVTSDGSKTLYHAEVGEHYHSRHGAVQESRHVFLGMGLQHFLTRSPTDRVSVLEVGFGTGLNFLLSADYCISQHVSLEYTGIEAFPLPHHIIAQTGYEHYVFPTLWSAFLSAYTDSLHTTQAIGQYGELRIVPDEVLHFESQQTYDVLYFDAFAAIHQPEMWTEETLKHVCEYLNPGGIFVTYAITGQLKRSMKKMGSKWKKCPALQASGKC